jgi:hypothetical protein
VRSLLLTGFLDYFHDRTNTFVTEVNQAVSDVRGIINDFPNPDPDILTLLQAVTSNVEACVTIGQTAADGIAAVEGLRLRCFSTIFHVVDQRDFCIVNAP